ncbi:hypothetical protein ACWJKU_06640 [Methylocaldum sp. MU1018]
MAKKHTSKHAEGIEKAEKAPAAESAMKAGEGPEHVAKRETEPSEGLGEAFKEGAEHARSTFAEIIPELGGMIHKSVYSGFYYLTYGAVFGSLLIGSLIPADSAMTEGVRDGAEAAKKAFEGRHEGTHEAAHADTSVDEGLTTA